MIYLDHAATTALRPQARDAFLAAASVVGNPSSVHAAGRAARGVMEDAREQVAALLGADPAEVIFTSGGTEGANLAVRGAALAAGRPAVAVSAVEHPAVLAAAHSLPDTEVRILPVDHTSRLVAEDWAAVDQQVGVVSVMWVNNETGVVQPIPQMVAAAHAAGAVAHSDAVQAVGHVPVDFHAAGLDALSFSGHKIGAPVGVGVLLARRELALTPQSFGGGQERAVRSGTLAAPLAAAVAAALDAAVSDLAAQAARLVALRVQVEQALQRIPGVRITGAGLPEVQRSPATVHAVLDNVDADSLLYALDRTGIAVSSGSACRAGVQEPSHVIAAMGGNNPRGGLRCSLGWTTTESDVAAFVAAVGPAVELARAAYRP